MDKINIFTNISYHESSNKNMTGGRIIMKKIVLSCVALCMCFGVFLQSGNKNIHANEINIVEKEIESYGSIETREADWPDYNYGNWKDVAAHPEKHQKVVKCVKKVLKDMKIQMSVDAVLAALGKAGASVGTVLGAEAAVRFSFCMIG